PTPSLFPYTTLFRSQPLVSCFFGKTVAYHAPERTQELPLLIATFLVLGTTGGAVIVRAFVIEQSRMLAGQPDSTRGTEGDVRKVDRKSTRLNSSHDQ